MPPHLHPRSLTTTSLLGTTLLVSFLVVGMPHIIPCPAPRLAFAEGEQISISSEEGGGRRRRRRRKADQGGQEESISEEESVTLLGQRKESIKKARECPVPKPMGIIGSLLGSGKGQEEAAIPPKVRVETRKAERRRTDEAE